MSAVPTRTHLYRNPEAHGHADAAYGYMIHAVQNLEGAERQLTLSGYKGAARGIHQANERVKSWMRKVDAEVRAAGKVGGK